MAITVTDRASAERALSHLKGLPEPVRARLVGRTVPFGDVIDDATREVHATVPRIPRWQSVVYGLARAAKGDAAAEAEMLAAIALIV